MNREILFRGKLIGNDRWSYGNLVIKHNSISIITPDSTPLGRYGQVMPETVGQYTGLTDKNGKRIFEGDIVRYSIYPPGKFVYGDINYRNGVFGIAEQDCALCVCSADGVDEYKLEVIGNIHDNPELLEQEG